MGLNLFIDGSLYLTILDVVTKEPLNVTKHGREIEQGVFDNLQQGEYVINLKERMVYDLNDFGKPIYAFDFDVNEETEYEFREVEDDE